MVGSLGHGWLFSSICFILLGFVKGLAITISMPALRKGLKRISFVRNRSLWLSTRVGVIYLFMPK